MARRSAVDESPAVLDESWDDPPRAPKRKWGGGGGRWWIWVGRALLWAFVLVVVVNGIRAPFERFTAPATTAVREGDDGPRFPRTEASAYALQFAHVYLNYDQNSPDTRQEELARFLPEGADAQFGWDGLGQMSAQYIQVLSVDVKSTNDAVVNIAAKTGSRWVTLAVPLYARDGAFVVSEQPALLEAPKKAQLPQEGGTERDGELEARLKTDLTGFFQAYGNSDEVNLRRFTDSGDITGLGAAVTLTSIEEVNAPPGDSDERTVTATVKWKVPPTQPRVGTEGVLTQTYELVVVRKSDQWNVRSIRGAARAGS